MSTKTKFPAGSLLATSVTASSVTSAQQTAPPVFKTPTTGNLPAGHYDSLITDVADAVQNGQIVGVDCYHELIDSDGTNYRIRFRYYAPREVADLAQKIGSYGLSGSLGSLLQGLQELVDVAPKGGSSGYLSISHRTLQSTTQTTAASLSTTMQPTTATPATGSSATANALPRKTGGLSSRVKLGSQHKPSMSQRTLLISEEDDDDEDDLLDEDED
jgi:hypothetical protein